LSSLCLKERKKVKNKIPIKGLKILAWKKEKRKKDPKKRKKKKSPLFANFLSVFLVSASAEATKNTTKN
jgi:hypothetical protein